MKKITLDSSVGELSGVGATRLKQLEKLGVTTIKELIYLFPRAYEKRGNVKTLAEATHDSTLSFILTVASEVKNAALRKGLTVSKFRAFDESGSCEVTFFNAPFVKDVFRIGSEFRFYGKVAIGRNKIQLTNPKYEPIIPGSDLPDLTPIYPLTDGISSKFIDKITKIAIDETLYAISDPLPDEIRIKYSLPVLSYALRNIHFPENEEALAKAISRLAFDEMMLFGLGVALSSQHKKLSRGAAFMPCNIKELTSLLPYELTGSQKNAINDIYKDTVFKNENGEIYPMARIIVGDVGSGKTICAISALYLAVKSGYQAALLAPTEILARQHYHDACELLSKLGIKVELLLGATTQKEKKRIYADIQSGEPCVVIGTHALLSNNVDFSNLGLIITDEQHRFGVEQRGVLKDKTKSAHLLVMSATPIPRTLALTMYGDLDVSRITDMPKGRQRVDTFVVDETYRERLNSFIEKQVINGGQCYVVCPAIESDEDEENYFALDSFGVMEQAFSTDKQKLKNAVEYTDILRQRLPILNISCMHGKMKSAEKDRIMQEFSSGKIDVLVSTTVIEVGVNVPNASLMIVENADRFGLAQLHQLRGRVGRGSRKSYCVLVSDKDTEKAKARLDIMKTTYDGYEISEKDLLLRGPGDFFATTSQSALRQSGGFEFKLANLCDDSTLFTSAFEAAKTIILEDPSLSSDKNKELRQIVIAKIAPRSSTIS